MNSTSQKFLAIVWLASKFKNATSNVLRLVHVQLKNRLKTELFWTASPVLTTIFELWTFQIDLTIP